MLLIKAISVGTLADMEGNNAAVDAQVICTCDLYRVESPHDHRVPLRPPLYLCCGLVVAIHLPAYPNTGGAARGKPIRSQGLSELESMKTAELHQRLWLAVGPGLSKLPKVNFEARSC